MPKFNSQPRVTGTGLPSLTAMTEKRIFEDLEHSIWMETKNSIFAIGGTIPITSIPGMAICESDEVYEEGGLGIDEEYTVDAGREECSWAQDRVMGETVVARSEKMPMSMEVGSFGGDDGDDEDDTAYTHKMRCDPVTLRWDSSSDGGSTQKLTLPCDDFSRPAFEQLLRDCQPASFGRGGVDVMDESYRKAGKIDEKDFCSNFDPYAIGIIDAVAQVLMPDHGKVTNETRGLRAELYKLNVYSSPSGKFKAHVDTPRSKHQVGSLVVCLPSVHQGGQLVLRHEGREIVFDWAGEKGRNNIQWAAFFSDCEHEVLEVTAGHRLTLTYNLYATCQANTAIVDHKELEVHKLLTQLIREPAFCKSGLTLGYNCSHTYPHTDKDTIETLPAMLKGVDKLVHECFVAMGLEVTLRHQLNWDLHSYGGEFNNVLERTDDDGPWRVLKEDYTKYDDQDEHDDFYPVSFYPKEESNQAGDLALLSDDLVKLSVTDRGMDDGEYSSEIVEEWTRDYRLERVKWLNKKYQQQMALVHGTYGNNAGIGIKYCSFVITLRIPPFQDR